MQRAHTTGYKNLNAIDRNEQTDEVIDELYRDMHTIKGNAQLLDLTKWAKSPMQWKPV